MKITLQKRRRNDSEQCILLVAVLLQTLSFFAIGFSMSRRQSLEVARRPAMASTAFAAGKSMGDDEDYNDEDEPAVRPYRNRSLAWTLRYRRLNPYDKVRARVISFGHRSKDDWDDAVSSGQLGQYVPNHPDEMYAPEWVSWDEFLGLMRDYNETRNLATSILGLKSLDDYLVFVKSNSKRAEGLRIPVRPDLYYEDEWKDEQSFFGKCEQQVLTRKPAMVNPYD
ncbi:hypothetical protein ACHAW5_011362 [Stephanodiscus triporus]|uniref:Uncharacterized protein n=1 Tax=Stephanodiscus triporus TaxID=2934178 RepID=A0ABD3MPN5_9STRA